MTYMVMRRGIWDSTGIHLEGIHHTLVVHRVMVSPLGQKDGRIWVGKGAHNRSHFRLVALAALAHQVSI